MRMSWAMCFRQSVIRSAQENSPVWEGRATVAVDTGVLQGLDT